MTIIEYLHKKEIEYIAKGNELNINCPFCQDTERKLYINSTTGLFKCYHENRCGMKGNFELFQKKLGDAPKVMITDKHFKANKKKYKKPEPITYSETKQRFIDFFSDRKITNDTIGKYKIRVTEDKYIVFPVIKNGEIVNRKYRTLDKKFRSEKEAELCLFGMQHISISATDIIICEGEIDCMTYDQLGYSCVSMPSGVNNLDWIELDYDFLSRFNNIYLSLDMDKAGRQAVDKIAVRLGRWRCHDLHLPYKDINECVLNGITTNEIDRIIDLARDFNIPCLKTTNDFTQEVLKLVNNQEELSGYETGYKGLNDILMGWREGEVTVWTGKNGSGKSTFINKEILNIIMRHGHKACIGSFELKPARMLNWLAQTEEKIYLANPDRKTEVAEAWLDMLTDRLYMIDIVGEIKKEYLFEVMEYAIKKYGVKHFVIDSMMRISLPHYDELRQQKEFVAELKGLANDNYIHIHLITHPRKTDKDDDIIGQSDIAGTGHITDLADNVIVVHRLSEDQKEKARQKGVTNCADAILIVKKNREHGTTGKVRLGFDVNRKKHYELFT